LNKSTLHKIIIIILFNHFLHWKILWKGQNFQFLSCRGGLGGPEWVCFVLPCFLFVSQFSTRWPSPSLAPRDHVPFFLAYCEASPTLWSFDWFFRFHLGHFYLRWIQTFCGHFCLYRVPSVLCRPVSHHFYYLSCWTRWRRSTCWILVRSWIPCNYCPYCFSLLWRHQSLFCVYMDFLCIKAFHWILNYLICLLYLCCLACLCCPSSPCCWWCGTGRCPG